jgi:hypothetical protein
MKMRMRMRYAHQRWLLNWFDGYQQGHVSVIVTVTLEPSLQE